MKSMRASPVATSLLLLAGIVLAWSTAGAEERLIYKSKRYGTQIYHVLDAQNPIRVTVTGPTVLKGVFRLHVYRGTSLKSVKLVVQEMGKIIKSFRFRVRRGKKHYQGVREFVPSVGKRFKLKVPPGKHTYYFMLASGDTRKGAVHFKALLADQVSSSQEEKKLEKNVEPPVPLTPLVPVAKQNKKEPSPPATKESSGTKLVQVPGKEQGKAPPPPALEEGPGTEVLEAKLVSEDKEKEKPKPKTKAQLEESGKTSITTSFKTIEVGASLRTMYDENVLRESADGLSVFLGRPASPNFYVSGTPRHDITSRVDIVERVGAHASVSGVLLGKTVSSLSARYQGWLYTKNPILDRHLVHLSLGQELVKDFVGSWVYMDYVPSRYYRRMPWPDPALNPGTNFEFKKVTVTEKRFGIGAALTVHKGHRLGLQAGMESLDFGGGFSNLDRTGPAFRLSYLGIPASMLKIELGLPVKYLVAGKGSSNYRMPDPTEVIFGGSLKVTLILNTWRPGNLKISAASSVIGTWFLSQVHGDKEYGNRADLYYDAGAHVGIEVIEGLELGVGYSWYSNRADTEPGYSPFDTADYDGYMVFLDIGYAFKVEQ